MDKFQAINVTVMDIIKKYLEEKKYAGLANTAFRCNCSVEYLAPHRSCFLGELIEDCQPTEYVKKKWDDYVVDSCPLTGYGVLCSKKECMESMGRDNHESCEAKKT